MQKIGFLVTYIQVWLIIIRMCMLYYIQYEFASIDWMNKMIIKNASSATCIRILFTHPFLMLYTCISTTLRMSQSRSIILFYETTVNFSGTKWLSIQSISPYQSFKVHLNHSNQYWKDLFSWFTHEWKYLGYYFGIRLLNLLSLNIGI